MKALARQSVRVIFIEFIELERFGDIHQRKNSDHWVLLHRTKMYSEPCQTSKKEFFVKIDNDFQQLTIFVKNLD